MSIRNQAPPVHTITALNIPQASLAHLDNQIPVHYLPIGSQEVLKLELIFEAGRWQETVKMQSRLSAKMLKAGSRHKTAAQIADTMEFYGTKLKINDEFDYSSLQVFCLKKHFEPILALISELLTEASFPEQELESMIKRNKERLKVDLSKGDFVAYRELTEQLYGKEHPYGYNSSFELYDGATMDDLRTFYTQRYQTNQCKAVLTGAVDAQSIALLNKYLSILPVKDPSSLPQTVWPALPTAPARRTRLKLDKEQNMQASIRIGMRLFDKKHPDYAGFQVLNTVFGGYFGARLMQNLREDKGYTYGAYSSVDDLLHGGYFYIDTEVGQEVAEDALVQIYQEMDLLQQKLIPKSELEMVKSYLMGTYLNSLDGLFNLSNVLADTVRFGLGADYIPNIIATSQNISSQQLRELARVYLDKNNLCEVVVV